MGIRTFVKNHMPKKTVTYAEWQKKHEPDESALLKQRNEEKEDAPLISVISAEANASLRGQTYGFWESCRDAKEANGSILVFLLRHDVLSPDALYEAARAFSEHPGCGMAYADSDYLNEEGERVDPDWKPGYSPELLETVDYIGNPVFFSRKIYEEAGGIARLNDDALWDLTLQAGRKAKEVVHIPKILCHRGRNRMTPQLKEHSPEWIRIGDAPKVSVIIPNKDHVSDLNTCIESLTKTATYPNLEILVIENNSEEQKTFEYYERLEEQPALDGERKLEIKVLRYEDGFNYSAINNFAASRATGEYLLLLNNDTEVISADFIEQMLFFAVRRQVGIVGAKLYYPDDTVQHAGVVVGMGGIAGHVFTDDDLPRNFSAVTAACLLVEKRIYEEVGGMNEELSVAFNDVDFCLKVRRAGYRVVYQPSAKLYHYESKTRGAEDSPEKVKRFKSEIEIMKREWKDILENGDPYYNANLSMERPYELS